MTIVLAAMLLGIAGSAHCAAMCGPLVLLTHAPDGAPASGARRFGFSRSLMLHHAGRIAVYLSFGVFAGVIGAGASGLGWQRAIALVAGAAILLQATGVATRWLDRRQPQWIRAAILRLTGVARSLPAGHTGRPLLLGAINGLMPCGLLYAALAAAAGLGHLGSSLIFMAAFGLGTLPVFSLLMFSACTFVPRLPAALRRAAPLTLAVLGLLLIARGLPSMNVHGPAAHLAMHARH